MKLNFRQGVWKARNQSGLPDFLEYASSNNTITIDITTTPLVVSIVHGTKNYLIEQRKTLIGAWGPLEWNVSWGTEALLPTYYLYWAIDLASGLVTRGFTPYAPIYSYTTPILPKIDQHWFDKNENIFKVWDGTYWLPGPRLFAGSWDGTITHLPYGSQLELTYPDTLPELVDSGFILYGMDQKGIRDADTTFVTTAQPLSTNHGSFTSSVRLELASSSFIAAEPIPRYAAVTNNGNGTVSLASNVDLGLKPVGLAYQDAAIGESVDIVTNGILYSDSWTWDPALGLRLYCGSFGQLVQDSTGRYEVASILDDRYIIVRIDEVGAGGGGGGGTVTLERDVPVINTSVGAIDAGFTFLTGTTFTEFVELVSQRLAATSLILTGNPAPQFFEMGSIISPAFTQVFNRGSAGVQLSTRLRKNGTVISTAVPYTDLNIQMTPSTFSYVSEVNYAAGAPQAGGSFVPAGLAISNQLNYTGTYLAWFGTPASTPTTSANIRALPGSSFNSGNNANVTALGVSTVPAPNPSFTIAIPIGATRVVFAYPATSRSVASVKYQELSDSEVKANFVESSIIVPGANNYGPVAYRVFTYIPVEPFSIAVNYKVFI